MNIHLRNRAEFPIHPRREPAIRESPHRQLSHPALPRIQFSLHRPDKLPVPAAIGNRPSFLSGSSRNFMICGKVSDPTSDLRPPTSAFRFPLSSASPGFSRIRSDLPRFAPPGISIRPLSLSGCHHASDNFFHNLESHIRSPVSIDSPGFSRIYLDSPNPQSPSGRPPFPVSGFRPLSPSGIRSPLSPPSPGFSRIYPD